MRVEQRHVAFAPVRIRRKDHRRQLEQGFEIVFAELVFSPVPAVGEIVGLAVGNVRPHQQLALHQRRFRKAQAALVEHAEQRGGGDVVVGLDHIERHPAHQEMRVVDHLVGRQLAQLLDDHGSRIAQAPLRRGLGLFSQQAQAARRLHAVAHQILVSAAHEQARGLLSFRRDEFLQPIRCCRVAARVAQIGQDQRQRHHALMAVDDLEHAGVIALTHAGAKEEARAVLRAGGQRIVEQLVDLTFAPGVGALVRRHDEQRGAADHRPQGHHLRGNPRRADVVVAVPTDGDPTRPLMALSALFLFLTAAKHS